MAVRSLGFSLVAALALFPAALPAAPYLVKDLNTSSTLSGEVNLYDRGSGAGVSYFAAVDPAHGAELWRSDGTPGGTERLTDICAGPCNSLPAAITVHAGRVFFKANEGFSGEELWVSDGTPGSERRVRDLCPSVCSASPGRVGKAGDHLLFLSYFPGSGRYELWRTDGNREGTVRVKVICTTGCYEAGDLVSIGEKALFIVNGQGVWVTDGTTGGTRLLREITTYLSPSQLAPGDGFAWTWDSDGLWRTDGTVAGTFLLKRFDELTTRPDSYFSLSRQVLWHGTFFGVLYSGDVIRSDGTSEGTIRIASLPDVYLADIVPLDSEILFRLHDGPGDSVLWSTRGTEETTGPKFTLPAESPTGLTRISGDRAVFLAGPGDFFKSQLWVTDGTEAGTRQLALPPGVGSDGGIYATGDGRAFFFVYGPEYTLWITDGTEAGTRDVRGFGNVPGSSGPQQQASLGGTLVFSAKVPNGSAPLFISDGTADGTGLLNGRSDDASAFFQVEDRLFFSAIRPGRSAPEMWATDGTPGGTVRVSGYGFSDPALLGGQVLFNGTAGGALQIGSELMKTDALALRVDLVKDIDPFYYDANSASGERCLGESSSPVPGGVLGGRLLLAADDGRSGRELWMSDGTRAGTVPLRDINPGRSPEVPEACYYTPRGPHRHDTGLSSNPQDFVLLGSIALFTADDGSRGRELWVTNGTSPGTRRLVDLVPGARGSAPHDLVRFQGRVYFLAGNRGQGESLWSTDGTARGTTRVLDLTLDGLPSWGRDLTVAAGRLFFTVFNETTGAELWASTGDAGGTGLIIDLNPGPGSSSAQFLTSVGGTLLFTADDGLTGFEAWRTDGTAAGTVRLGDIAPGRDASSPGPFTALPAVVMTGADDGIHGREPWAFPKADVIRLE